jgi:hypothetical protein
LLADFVEHIAELGGSHLEMAGLSMPWYVRHRFDTGLFFLLFTGVFLLALVWLVRACRVVLMTDVSKRLKRD